MARSSSLSMLRLRLSKPNAGAVSLVLRGYLKVLDRRMLLVSFFYRLSGKGKKSLGKPRPEPKGKASTPRARAKGGVPFPEGGPWRLRWTQEAIPLTPCTHLNI